jgi:hypothetical protein
VVLMRVYRRHAKVLSWPILPTHTPQLELKAADQEQHRKDVDSQDEWPRQACYRRFQ